MPEEALAVLWGVRPGFLHAALGRIDTHHGGLDTYLAQRLNLGTTERARLAALYLEPA